MSIPDRLAAPSPATAGRQVPTPDAALPAAPRHGVRVVYLGELVKLAAQVRIRVAVGACVLGPLAFALVLSLTGNVPADTLFGRWVHDSGLALPLVVLGFASSWALPLLTCLVAGDVFSAEDQHGTWKTLLTRSRSRSEVFWGKVLAVASYAATVVVLLTASSLAAGVLVVGRQPLVGLSGTLVAPGHAVVLVLASWASALPPALAFAALGVLVSVATRTSLVGILAPTVLGLVMQLLLLVDGPPAVRTLLLSSAFLGWHGLFATPSFTGPLLTGAVVSTAYVAVSLAAARWLLLRRDVTGG